MHTVSAQHDIASEPQFPGGTTAFGSWLNEHLYKSYGVLKADIKGVVDATIVIDPDGVPADLTINSSTNDSLNVFIFNLMRKSPDWLPAKDAKGKTVRGSFRHNFEFKQQKVSYKAGESALNTWLETNVYRSPQIRKSIGEYGYKNDCILIVNRHGIVSKAMLLNKHTSLSKSLNSSLEGLLLDMKGWDASSDASDTSVVCYAKLSIKIPGKQPCFTDTDTDGESWISSNCQRLDLELADKYQKNGATIPVRMQDFDVHALLSFDVDISGNIINLETSQKKYYDTAFSEQMKLLMSKIPRWIPACDSAGKPVVKHISLEIGCSKIAGVYVLKTKRQ